MSAWQNPCPIPKKGDSSLSGKVQGGPLGKLATLQAWLLLCCCSGRQSPGMKWRSSRGCHLSDTLSCLREVLGELLQAVLLEGDNGSCAAV